MRTATTGAQPLVFKRATDLDELDQVHHLNYQTFVEEIPQHAANDRRMLVDRFDDENAYLICRRGRTVVGMIAVRGTRPFSLDEKLPELDRWLPAGRSFCEVRLLAVHPDHRRGVVFHGLLRELVRHCLGEGYDAAVISGTVRQLKLYEHLGFVPFGPRVGHAGAVYQPMYLTLEASRRWADLLATRRNGARHAAAISFLPGPVDIHPDVRAALGAAPVSHREGAFMVELRQTKQLLCRLADAEQVELLVGSGTLANDVVAGQIATIEGEGLVLSNGEFGERLIDHARRAGLAFDTERLDWGRAFDAKTLDRVFAGRNAPAWCWMVHVETSTGVLNDLPRLANLCVERGITVCADCISAIGTVPVSLQRVHLASAVSGKGLGAFSGLSMVFHHGGLRPSPRLPRYLDLAVYAEANGVPFTHSSNLVGALRVAAERTLRRRALAFADVRRLAAWLRRRLRGLGYRIVAPDQVASPAILTLALDDGQSAEALGDSLTDAGFALSYRSDYLRARNWIQIALMGEFSREKLELLLEALGESGRRRGPPIARRAAGDSLVIG